MVRWNELIQNEAMMRKHVEALSELVNQFDKSINESYCKDAQKIFSNDKLSDKAKLEAFYLGDHGVYRSSELKRIVALKNDGKMPLELEREIQQWRKQGSSEGSIMMNLVAKVIQPEVHHQDKLESAAEAVVKEIAAMVKQNESEFNQRPLTDRLFVYTLAVGGYNRILQNARISNVEKLQSIYSEAFKLSAIEKFNRGTTLHRAIKDLSRQALNQGHAQEARTKKRKVHSR
jgi:hypothetical protein